MEFPIGPGPIDIELFIELPPIWLFIELLIELPPIWLPMLFIMLLFIIDCELGPLLDRLDPPGVLFWDDFLTVSLTGPQAGQFASLHFR